MTLSVTSVDVARRHKHALITVLMSDACWGDSLQPGMMIVGKRPVSAFTVDVVSKHEHALETMLTTDSFWGDSLQPGMLIVGMDGELSLSGERLVGIVGAPWVSLRGVAGGLSVVVHAGLNLSTANITTSVAMTAHKAWRETLC